MEVESSSRNSTGDGDQTPIVGLAGGYNRNQRPFENGDDGGAGNCNNSPEYHHHHIPTKNIIKKTIPYLIALPFACLLLYNSPSHIDYYFSNTSPHPSPPFDLSRNSRTTTHQDCNSSYPNQTNNLPDSLANTSASSNNSSITSTEESLGFNTSSSMQEDISAPVGNVSASSNNTFMTSTEESLGFNTSSTMQDESAVTTSSAPSPTAEETKETELEHVLHKAATGKKTVVVTTVNAAWTEPGSLFELLLESMKNGNGTQKFINHLVVIALDQKSYNRCSEIHPHCVAITTEGIDFSAQEAFFMTPAYLRLVWRKIECMYLVLKLGYDAIFTDTDILWFRDPFLHFLEDADIQSSSDYYMGGPTKGYANTGFYYAKSNDRTIYFFEFWLKSRFTYENEHDQQVYQKISVDPLIVEKISIKIRLLDTAFYGGSCEPSKDLDLVCTMHANCCFGLHSKRTYLRMLLEKWKKYVTVSNEEQTNAQHTWPFPLGCS